MLRATLSVQTNGGKREPDPKIIFEGSGLRLLKRMTRKFGELKSFAVLYCADVYEKEGRVPDSGEIQKLFLMQPSLKNKYEPLNSSMRQSAISAGTRMAYAICDTYSSSSNKRVAQFLRQRVKDPAAHVFVDSFGKKHQKGFKSWFQSASTPLTQSSIIQYEDETYLRLSKIGLYYIETRPNRDWTKLSGVTIYLKEGEYYVRFRFGKGSRAERLSYADTE